MLDINLLGLLRPDFAVVFGFPLLVFVLAVELLAVVECGGVLSLEPLDDTPVPELLADGFSWRSTGNVGSPE